jgi:catechol 2,3-dioxygenase-like lactoylglutathione lyase family enzyme
MTAQLEHANMTVTSLDEAVRFLTTALPDFQPRGGGDSANGGRWLHVGTDDSYIALHEPATADETAQTPSRGPVNHLGFVVDDADSLHQRLTDAGYRQGYVAPTHPYRKRVCFLDNDGGEWEFVQYLSDNPSQRND